MSRSRRRRFAIGLAGAATAVYLGLFAAAVSPSARVREHAALGVTRDSQLFRTRPFSVLRYYAAVHGNAYLYYEIGVRFAGRTLPPLTDPVAARLAQVRDARALASSSPQLPYRDFDAVYPPLAALYFRAIASATSSFDGFLLVLRLLNLGAVIATLALAQRTIRLTTGTSPHDYWVVAILLSAALGPRFLSYYDAVAGLGLALALHEASAGRWTMAGAAIAAGIWLKVVALFLGPLFLLGAWRTGGKLAASRLLAGVVIMSVFVALPWILSGDAHFVIALFTQGQREYLEYGSLLGSTIVVLRRLGMASFEYGGELDSLVIVSRLSATLAALAAPAMLAAVSAVLVAARRTCGPGDRRWLLACCATVTAVLMAAPVFSPQYNLMLLAVLLVSGAFVRPIWPLAAVCFLVTQVQHPVLEGLPDSARETGRAIVFLVRNALLVAILWLLWRGLRETARPHCRVDVAE